MAPTSQEVRDVLKHLLLKDLRVNLRNRGVNPAGSREALIERLYDNIMETQNYDFVTVDGGHVQIGGADQNQPPSQATHASVHQNNFHRPDGQNTGNYITDRPSSRVTNNPGGASQIVFGDEAPPLMKKPSAPTITVNAGGAAPPAQAPRYHDIPASNGSKFPEIASTNSLSGVGEIGHSNNYHRPGGQNVGNFLTDRNSSRVTAPPGGVSQVFFG